jgi:threonine synthase
MDVSAPPKMLDAFVGNTPVVKLSKVVTPEMAEVWVKLEGQNPAGSIKDRTALGMILDAEERGILTPAAVRGSLNRRAEIPASARLISAIVATAAPSSCPIP